MAALICSIWAPAPSFGQGVEVLGEKWSEDARQFDFWIGKWDINLRTLQDDKQWQDSVKATAEIYPILDGKAILELWDAPTIKGFSLRYFDPTEKQWVLYLNWPGGNRSSIGRLTGEFRHGRGEFFSPSKGAAGRSVISRYTFCDITPTSLRWDDAFSDDGGKSWSANWIMEFSRTAEIARWPVGSTAHTFDSGKRCPGSEFTAIQSMAGRWAGTLVIQASDGDQEVPATLNAYQVLGGCSTLRFLEYELDDTTRRSFGLLTYNPAIGAYEELVLDNQVDSRAHVLRGKGRRGKLSLTAEGKRDLLRHQWTLPTARSDRLELRVRSSVDGKKWRETLRGGFERIAPKAGSVKRNGQAAGDDDPINRRCPRSGKPIATNSLATYRGHVVGFCNPHCRDDFASNPEGCAADRAFFDKLIAKLPTGPDDR